MRNVNVETIKLTQEVYGVQHRNNLTQQLYNYADSSRDCGLSEAARNADAEAVELTRTLYDLHPNQYRNDLAQRLKNYSVSLRCCGLSEAARDADAEALELI